MTIYWPFVWAFLFYYNDIRKAVNESGVRFWQIADDLGITDQKLSRKMRYELPDEEKAQILSIIKRLSERKE